MFLTNVVIIMHHWAFILIFLTIFDGQIMAIMGNTKRVYVYHNYAHANGFITGAGGYYVKQMQPLQVMLIPNKMPLCSVWFCLQSTHHYKTSMANDTCSCCRNSSNQLMASASTSCLSFKNSSLSVKWLLQIMQCFHDLHRVQWLKINSTHICST